MDPTKLNYLRELCVRDEVSATEQHELEMAVAVHGQDWWMTSSDRAFNASADAVAAFRAEHGRWPSQKGERPDERRLSRQLRDWRSGLRQDAAHLTTERLSVLDRVLPGWRESIDAVWDATAEAVAAFHQSKARWPSSGATDETERQLGHWLVRFRYYSKHAGAGRTAARCARLDELAPGWRHGR
jgi:hypothetical protein